MTSRIILPDALGDRVYQHAVTGAEIRPVSSGSQHWVFVGQLFESMPVAILRSVSLYRLAAAYLSDDCRERRPEAVSKEAVPRA